LASGVGGDRGTSSARRNVDVSVQADFDEVLFEEDGEATVCVLM
jgi:hypothetical protein